MGQITNDHSRGPLARIVEWITRGWEGASEAEMIAALDEKTISDIAHDCGISPEQLVELAKAGPHAADEMPEMMRTLLIDPTEVELRFRALFRDMQINCSRCHAKRQCRTDLKDGTAPTEFVDYCANSDDLNVLRAIPEVRMH